jgi:hypothetical protein
MICEGEKMNTKMRLSEAMRLGAMMVPQGRVHRHINSLGNRACSLSEAVKACALGHAQLAAGISDINEKYAESLWPILLEKLGYPPGIKLCWDPRLIDAITRLNDSFGWTTNQIADWVESIERAEEAAAQVSQENQELAEVPMK